MNTYLFIFFVKNPFDCAVAHREGTDNLVIICIRRKKICEEAFIIPYHLLHTDEIKIFTYKEGFEHNMKC